MTFMENKYEREIARLEECLKRSENQRDEAVWALEHIGEIIDGYRRDEYAWDGEDE